MARRRSQSHRRRAATGGRAIMQLNLPAMIDVIFLLLIFFVVTANFIPAEGVLTAHMPQTEGDREQETEQEPLDPPPQPLIVQLHATGGRDVTILVGDRQEQVPDFAALGRALEAVQHAPERGREEGLFRPDDPLVIFSDERVRWQHVVDAFNAAVRAGYTNVRMDRQ